ncbi:MAG: IS3 family transposase [bacterium]
MLTKGLGVSPSGYYAQRSRPPCLRAQADAALLERIRVIHERSRRTYGAPRVHAELREQGLRCGRKRVARLMRQAGLCGAHRRRRGRTTVRDQTAAPAPDLVARAFVAERPNRLWGPTSPTFGPGVAGCTCRGAGRVQPTSGGLVNGRPLRTELVLKALNMAVWNRRPAPGLIHHSDRGCQYTSLTFGRRCRDAGIVPSMGQRADAYDTQSILMPAGVGSPAWRERSRWAERSDPAYDWPPCHRIDQSAAAPAPESRAREIGRDPIGALCAS